MSLLVDGDGSEYQRVVRRWKRMGSKRGERPKGIPKMYRLYQVN
jgi:hypothetical protein